MAGIITPYLSRQGQLRNNLPSRQHNLNPAEGMILPRNQTVSSDQGITEDERHYYCIIPYAGYCRFWQSSLALCSAIPLVLACAATLALECGWVLEQDAAQASKGDVGKRSPVWATLVLRESLVKKLQPCEPSMIVSSSEPHYADMTC